MQAAPQILFLCPCPVRKGRDRPCCWILTRHSKSPHPSLQSLTPRPSWLSFTRFPGRDGPRAAPRPLSALGVAAVPRAVPQVPPWVFLRFGSRLVLGGCTGLCTGFSLEGSRAFFFSGFQATNVFAVPNCLGSRRQILGCRGLGSATFQRRFLVNGRLSSLNFRSFLHYVALRLKHYGSCALCESYRTPSLLEASRSCTMSYLYAFYVPVWLGR